MSNWLYSFFLFLAAPLLAAYPQTITKNYKRCDTCHVDSKGGGLLHDYGRSMSEIFMASWAIEGEATEFGLFKSRVFDVGGDARYLSYANSKAQNSSLKALEIEGSAKVGTIRLNGTIGQYGIENKQVGYRRSGLSIRITQKIDFKVGRFVPAYGLGINQHIRWIKSRLGLGQGRELFSAEVYYRNRMIKSFLTWSRPRIEIFGSDEGKYVFLSDSTTTDILSGRISYISVKGLEVGSSLQLNSGNEPFQRLGIFSRYSPHPAIYILSEFDYDRDLFVGYTRSGFYPFLGFDIYAGLEYAHTFENAWNDLGIFTGIDWMIRPRIEWQLMAEYQLFQNPERENDYRIMSMIHLWL
jgi:hypothetical protein